MLLLLETLTLYQIYNIYLTTSVKTVDLLFLCCFILSVIIYSHFLKSLFSSMLLLLFDVFIFICRLDFLSLIYCYDFIIYSFLFLLFIITYNILVLLYAFFYITFITTSIIIYYLLLIYWIFLILLVLIDIFIISSLLFSNFNCYNH